MIAPIREQAEEAGRGGGLIFKSDFHSKPPIRCRISLSFPSSLSRCYASAPLITMFTTCWHPERCVGFGRGAQQIKERNFENMSVSALI